MIIYPASLPAPARWDMTPRERRAKSVMPGLPAARRRTSSRLLDVQAEWVYRPEHMAVWRPWFDDDLMLGLKWFRASLPGYGGWIVREARYRPNTLRLQHIANGIYRVAIQLEVRYGLGEPTGPAPPDAPAHLLLEDGDDILLESGFLILLED